MSWSTIKTLHDRELEAILKANAYYPKNIPEAGVNLAKFLHSKLAEPGVTVTRDMPPGYGTCNSCGKLLYIDNSVDSHDCMHGFTH